MTENRLRRVGEQRTMVFGGGVAGCATEDRLTGACDARAGKRSLASPVRHGGFRQ